MKSEILVLKKHVLFCLMVLLLIDAKSQELTPSLLGFEGLKMIHQDWGEINYYLSKGAKDLPLLMYLDGSGPFPLFQKMDQGIGSTVVIDFQNLTKDYRILLISKPGIPFLDKVGKDSNGFPSYEPPIVYNKRLTLDWRVNVASTVIDQILKDKLADTKKIVVLGFSEGAQVAPHLASINGNVTHLMLFGGNGLNQFFYPIISARMEAKIGKITEEQAQKTVDSLFRQYKAIYAKPKDVESSWWGHSYARWSSFTEKEPLEALVGLDIPIYIANGSLDENSVLSADYIKLDFIRRGKENLTYKTYPNLDHQFNEVQRNENGFLNTTPKIQSVMADAFKWLENN